MQTFISQTNQIFFHAPQQVSTQQDPVLHIWLSGGLLLVQLLSATVTPSLLLQVTVLVWVHHQQLALQAPHVHVCQE